VLAQIVEQRPHTGREARPGPGGQRPNGFPLIGVEALSRASFFRLARSRLTGCVEPLEPFKSLPSKRALAGRDYLLGDTFSMADAIFGGTLRYMLRFKMLEVRPAFTAYAERLAARPALERAEARNNAIIDERGLRR
jgi:Glutathione S-transferase, C-terminal domain